MRQGNLLTNLSSNKQILLIMAIGLITRLIALPFVHTVDADAVSRIYIAYRWLQNPYFISSAVWLPLHHYMNAFVIWVSGGELIYSLKVLHILFAVATVIPLYKFTENEFKTKEGAFFVALTYLFIPIILRNSFHVLSGIPYAFFIATAMYLLSQGKKLDKPIKFGILAGLSMTIAGGLRYEAWLLIAVFTLILILQKQWRMVLFFWVFAMIFPAVWMTGSFIEHGDLFYGSNGAYRWNIVLMGGNDDLSWRILAWRSIYYIRTYFILFTPIIAFAIIYYAIKSLWDQEMKKSTKWWLIPFTILMIVFTYKAINGTLFLQSRFVISLVITSIPFYAIVFRDKRNIKFKRIIAWSVIILLIPYSYLWKSDVDSYLSMNDVEAFPRIHDKETMELLKNIQTETHKGESKSLVMDFIGWDKTYFIRLRSGVAPNDAFLVNGAKYGKVYPGELAKKIEKNETGIILKKHHSKLDEHFHFINDSLLEVRKVSKYLQLKSKIVNDKITLYTYELSDRAPSIFYSDRKLLKENETEILQIENQIKADNKWYNSMIPDADKRGVEIDTMIRINAIYLYKQKLKQEK